MSRGAVCGPRYIEIKLPVEFCSTCERPRRMLYRLAAWYGAEWTCLTCGEEFNSDEGRKERPFRRGWREDNVRRAKDFWRRHGRLRLTRRALLEGV